ISDSLDFYILDAGISSLTKSRLESLVADYQSTLTWLTPSSKKFRKFPIKRYGIATYYRLAVASLLPQHLDKVIYLDCDMLVADDIAELWRATLYGNIVGAVENLGIAPKGVDIDRQEYFNAGMLVIDLATWRANNVEAALFECMATFNESLQYLDQDALNLVLRGRWKRLPLRWNLQPSAWSKVEKNRTSQTGYTHQEFVDALQSPGIIHFLAKSKPWELLTFHPYKKTYMELAAQLFPDTVSRNHATFQEKAKRLFQLEKHFKDFFRRKTSCQLSYNKPGIFM
ncbi:glycosyltransferase family 8 protein, partial [Salinicola peritrichatus]|uniref:glycosyltransferase family 8 protein n=1 Tax=Salinicola peritrichatus TaxID=1267424 RepID=UPI0013A67B1E